METSDFYVNLPSNTQINKEDVWRQNTTSQFRVRLPHEMRLVGEWQVALAEILYPHSWDNVTYDADDSTGSENSVIFARIAEPRKVYHSSIDAGHYDTAEGLLQALEYSKLSVARVLNAKIKMTKSKEEKAELMEELELFDPNIELEYNKKRRRVIATGDGEWIIVLSHKMQYILGFNKKIISAGDLARYAPDVRGGIDSLYVYSDICEPQIVGDSLEQVLRIVPVGGEYGELVDKVFVSPHYINVLKKSFSTIDINIKTDTNKPVPFAFGKCVLKLHFRKKK